MDAAVEVKSCIVMLLASIRYPRPLCSDPTIFGGYPLLLEGDEDGARLVCDAEHHEEITIGDQIYI